MARGEREPIGEAEAGRKRARSTHTHTTHTHTHTHTCTGLGDRKVGRREERLLLVSVCVFPCVSLSVAAFQYVGFSVSVLR